MPTQVWRPGDYRVCPSCSTRHKVQELRCTHCNTILAGTAVRHAAAPTVPATAARSSRALRAVLAVAFVLALGAGLWMRSLFRGAALQDSVEASNTVTAPIPAAAPSWTPPVLSYPPAVGYSSGVPSSMMGLSIQASPLPAPGIPLPANMSTTGSVSASTLPSVEAAPVAGMIAIAPSSAPTGKTAFTNDDLERRRREAAPVAAMPAVSSAAAVTGAATGGAATAVSSPPRPATSVSDDDVRKWTSRLRDREDDVRDAQSKVRRLEAEAAVKRAQAQAAAGDPDSREKAEREVADSLEDLEKAERKLSEKQRDLDETMAQARAAGIRFENELAEG